MSKLQGPKGRESIASGFALGNLFYRVGERREWKEGTEGYFTTETQRAQSPNKIGIKKN
jgi:hypothetical protein